MNINDQIQQHSRLVYYALKKYYPGFYTDEDIRQCGFIGLWKAIETYDASRGYQFSVYAIRCITNTINHEFRRRNKWSKLARVSLDAPIPETEDTTYAETLIAEEDYSAIYFYENYARLSESQKYLLELKSQGYTEYEIGDMIGKSQSTVNRRIHSIQSILTA